MKSALLFNPTVTLPSQVDESGGVRVVASDEVPGIDVPCQNVLYFSSVGELETFALQLHGLVSSSRALATGKITLAS